MPVRAKTDRKGTDEQSQMSGTDRVRAQESERQSLVSIVNILRAHGPLTRLDLERETHLGRAVVLDRLATLVLAFRGDLLYSPGWTENKMPRLSDHWGTSEESALAVITCQRCMCRCTNAFRSDRGPQFARSRCGDGKDT